MAKAKSRAARPDVWAERAVPQPAAQAPAPDEKSEVRLPAMLGGSLFTNMMDGKGLFGYINIGVAIFLIYLGVWGILNAKDTLFMPFGFGLLGLRFFLAYVETNLRVNLGRATAPLHYAILLSALVCFVLGMSGIGT